MSPLDQPKHELKLRKMKKNYVWTWSVFPRLARYLISLGNEKLVKKLFKLSPLLIDHKNIFCLVAAGLGNEKLVKTFTYT